jgi:cation:H+ antiporter
MLAIFIAAAIATWIAGIYLSRTTDALDTRLHLGDALGGLILLAIAGSLPELAITVSAVTSGALDIAAGNLIGGIAAQTLVLVLCDRAVKGQFPLSFLVGSLIPVLEGVLVIIVVGITLMGAMLPPTSAVGPFSPASIAVVVAWAAGLVILNRIRNAEPWEVAMPQSRPGRRHVRETVPDTTPPFEGRGTARIFGIFLAASLVTLLAGVALERSGDGLATAVGINGVVFGATFLAFASALPEISSGVTAVRLGDNQLAVADIFGGNAFQLCLFLIADAIAGRPVLPSEGISNAWLSVLGIVMTGVCIGGIIVRERRRILGVGIDSLTNIFVYIAGVIGLVAITR